MDSRILIKETASGLRASFAGKRVQLKYPNKIWQAYPRKIREVLVDNLAHLLTISLPLVAKTEKLHYNTALPAFQPYYQTVVLRSVPAAVEDYTPKTQEVMKQFLNTQYVFSDHQTKLPKYHGSLHERAIASFSSGKDSLLTLAVADELGLEPVAVYVNDTVSPKENRMKTEFAKRLSKEKKIPIYHIVNEFEKLNDFETWNQPESCLGYSHMLTGFSLLALPFMHFYKAKYLLFGNQQDMNIGFVNKDGFRTFPSFDQVWHWTKHQSTMVSLMTNNQGKVSSVIEPLTNLGIVKVLFSRYPEFAKYQISCDCSDMLSRPQRWCYSCPKCARLFLFMKAHGIDVSKVGFTKNFFEKKYQNHFSFSSSSGSDEYERSHEAKEQQLLAFYLAYRNGAKGYLIEKFRKSYYSVAKAREDELVKKFLSVNDSKTMPVKLKTRVMRIYKEEL